VSGLTPLGDPNAVVCDGDVCYIPALTAPPEHTGADSATVPTDTH